MIERIAQEEVKREIAARILRTLPDWFGLPESTRAYIEESAAMPFFAYRQAGEAVGFVALKETGPYTAEIFVMGVLPEYHRKGIGRALFGALYEYAKEKGYEFLQVKTVDAGHYEEYDRTRLFYEGLGFRKLEVFPALWDAWNPCLVLVMAVK